MKANSLRHLHVDPPQRTPCYRWVFPKIGGTPKSSILIRVSLINHPFWGTPIFGNTYIGDEIVPNEARFIKLLHQLEGDDFVRFL